MEMAKQKFGPQDFWIEVTSLYKEVPQTTFCLDLLHGEDLKKSPGRSENYCKI